MDKKEEIKEKKLPEVSKVFDERKMLLDLLNQPFTKSDSKPLGFSLLQETQLRRLPDFSEFRSLSVSEFLTQKQELKLQVQMEQQQQQQQQTGLEIEEETETQLLDQGEDRYF